MSSSLRGRLTLTMVISIGLSLLLLSMVVVHRASVQMETAITERVQADLVAKRVILAEQIQDYFARIDKDVSYLGQSEVLRQAALELSVAHARYADQLRWEPDALEDTLAQLYETRFRSAYDKRNSDPLGLLPDWRSVSRAGQLLQRDYIAYGQNPSLRVERSPLPKHSTQTDYYSVHERVDPILQRVRAQFGYYDVFLVDAPTGDIVYSVFKEIDFATSLLDGPFAQSGLGEAFRGALDLDKGQTFLSDFAEYRPSYDDAASFVSTPLFSNGTMVAVVVVQLPIDEINEVLTQKRQWNARGLGETGEIYIVGADKRIRNESRFFIENRSGYIESLRKIDPDAARSVEKKGSSIVRQVTDTGSVRRALAGESGFSEELDYRGVDVLSSYAPLRIGGLHWAIIAEIDRAEAFAPVADLQRDIVQATLIALGILLVLGAGAATFVVRGITRPLERLTRYTMDVAEGKFIEQPHVRGCREAEELGLHFNVMVRKVADLSDSLTEKVNARTAELATALEKLKTLNRTDALTNIANRRSFEERGASEVQRAIRYNTPLSLVMFDVDHFKSINDTHGHAAGDTVLKSIAALVHGRLRESDLVARVGGEEFCVLLPGAPVDNAMELVEELRQGIEEQRFLFSGTAGLSATCSFGVTCLSDCDPNLSSMMEHADQALYEAKRNGRNRTIRFARAA